MNTRSPTPGGLNTATLSNSTDATTTSTNYDRRTDSDGPCRTTRSINNHNHHIINNLHIDDRLSADHDARRRSTRATAMLRGSLRLP